MKTFILIHGSWHSAWNWHRVIPLLEQSGYQVFAIDLPGMGRDKTPIHQVSLESSVAKICELIDRIDGQVILVGHSKNGIMISQAAEYRPSKIEKLIYLAAYLVPNGKAQAEYSAMDTKGVLKPFVVKFPDTNSHILLPEIYQEGLYHDCDQNVYQLARLILNHESALTGTTPLVLSDENYGSVPRYYIECTEDRAVTPFIQQKMYSELTCKEVFKIPTSHSPFFSRPNLLCEIFSKIANY